MITFIEGKIDEKQPTRVVVNVQGMGYEVLIPLSSYDRLPREGEPCRLLTHHHVREDAQVLYGFMSADERSVFQRLLSISGIGPKIALSALSGLSPKELKRAVLEGDIKRLSSISGVGRKMAERMVVELKDKIGEGEALEAVSDSGVPGDNRMRDATLALVSLGYKQADAQKMLKRITETHKETAGVEELVRLALTG